MGLFVGYEKLLRDGKNPVTQKLLRDGYIYTQLRSYADFALICVWGTSPTHAISTQREFTVEQQKGCNMNYPENQMNYYDALERAKKAGIDMATIYIFLDSIAQSLASIADTLEEIADREDDK